MTYYAKQMENGEIIALHTMDRPFPTVEGFVPITETEYTELIAEWEATHQEPEPPEEPEYTTYEELASVIREGVNSIDE